VTIERNTNPLPKGRYWITVLDSPEGQLASFDEWLSDVSGSVKVESSELDRDSKPPSQFVIFNVTGLGAFFNAEQFGFPNKAPAGIKNREDAEQAPVIDEPGLADALQFAKTAGKVAVGLVLLKLGIELFRKRG
jgi:hypothetical protein